MSIGSSIRLDQTSSPTSTFDWVPFSCGANTGKLCIGNVRGIETPKTTIR